MYAITAMSPAVSALQSAGAGASPPVVAIRWIDVVPASGRRPDHGCGGGREEQPQDRVRIDDDPVHERADGDAAVVRLPAGAGEVRRQNLALVVVQRRAWRGKFQR